MSMLLDLLFGKESTNMTPNAAIPHIINVKKILQSAVSKSDNRRDYSDKFVCNHVIDGKFFREIRRNDEHYLVDVHGNVKPMIDQLGRHVRS